MSVEVIVFPRRVSASLRRLRMRLAFAWFAAVIVWIGGLAVLAPASAGDPAALVALPAAGGIAAWVVGWVWRPGQRRPGLQRSLG